MKEDVRAGGHSHFGEPIVIECRRMCQHFFPIAAQDREEVYARVGQTGQALDFLEIQTKYETEKKTRSPRNRIKDMTFPVDQDAPETESAG